MRFLDNGYLHPKGGGGGGGDILPRFLKGLVSFIATGTFFFWICISDLPVNNHQKNQERADYEHLGSILWGRTIHNMSCLLSNAMPLCIAFCHTSAP